MARITRNSLEDRAGTTAFRRRSPRSDIEKVTGLDAPILVEIRVFAPLVGIDSAGYLSMN